MFELAPAHHTTFSSHKRDSLVWFGRNSIRLPYGEYSTKDFAPLLIVES